jgi:hypothetical protein
MVVLRAFATDNIRAMSHESRLRETLDAFVARVREELDARAQDLTGDLTRAIQEADAAVRSESDRAMAAEREHLEAQLSDERAALAAEKLELENARRDLDQQIADREAALTTHRAGAIAVPVADRPGSSATSADMLTRLVESIRRLDAAPSLSGILEALAQNTLGRASRVAIFVVNGETLKSWGHFGFEPGQGAFDLPVDAVKVLTSALSTQQSAVFRAVAPGDDPSLPPFMRPPDGHVGLVAPLVVGGQVVAVLYADGSETGDAGGGHSSWAEEVELITRHARSRLENVTSERTVTALTRSL